MDGVARASGAGVIHIRIPKAYQGEGKPQTDAEGFDDYIYPPMRVEEYSVIEQHLLKNRVSPVDAVLPELERLSQVKSAAARGLMRALEKQAYRDMRKKKEANKVTLEEVEEYINTPEGALFAMKICLQRKHPDITDAEIRRIYDWYGEQEMRRLREVAQGIDKMGNSTGPNQEPEAVRAETAVSRGDGFTDGSLKSTDGLPPKLTT